MAQTPIISKDKLLESGLQYGHQTKSWNPAMKPFIAMSKNKIHFINLDRTILSLNNAYNIVKKIVEKNGTFLFVGTTKQSSKTVKENAERVGAFYINHRWLGGTLTNFRTIQKSINKLRNLERLEKTNFEGYTKKEGVQMRKELEKLEKVLGGIKFMRRIPSAIFVTSIKNEDIAIKEAKKIGIPIFGIADTNTNPYDVTFPIFGNDDGNKACSLVTTIIADAIASSKGGKQFAAFAPDEKVIVMGIEERKEGNFQFKNNINNKKNNFQRSDKFIKFDKKIKEEKPIKLNENLESNLDKNENNIDVPKNLIDFSKMKVIELKKILEDKEIKFSKLDKKSDLIKLIENN